MFSGMALLAAFVKKALLKVMIYSEVWEESVAKSHDL
ncbi:hypothetical protein Gotur_027195 [Gossypium turneri]